VHSSKVVEQTITCICLCALLAPAGSSRALAAQGDLDLRFGRNGIAKTALGASGLTSILAAGVLDDGRIELVGATGDPQTLILTRFNPDGTPDVSLGGSGAFTLSIESPYEGFPPAQFVAAVGGQSILLARPILESRVDVTDVKLIDPNGTLLGGNDPAIGMGAHPDAVAVDGIGRGFVVGMDGFNFFLPFLVPQALVQGYTIGGALVPTFDVATRSTLDMAGLGAVTSAELGVSERRLAIVADIDHQSYVLGYDGDGNLDQNFGSNGIVAVALPDGGSPTLLAQTAAQPDGSVVLAGSKLIMVGGIHETDREVIWVRHYDPTGMPSDTDIVTSSDAFPQAFVVAPDGKVVLTGTTGSNYLLGRLLPSLQMDPSFGFGGIVEQQLGVFAKTPNVTVQPNGNVLVFGLTTDTPPEIAVERFIGTSCGDGVTDPGEACDDGVDKNGTADSCCTAVCTLRAAGTPCRSVGTCDAGGVCTPPASDPDCVESCGTAFCPQRVGLPCSDDGNPCTTDLCDGAGLCAHLAGNAGTQCRSAVGECTLPATCSGTSAVCPANPGLKDGTSCHLGGCDPGRSICESGACVCLPVPWPGCGNGVVDVGEECGEPGLPGGPCCVACRLADAGTVCRASVNACDIAEVCNGFSADCPPDAAVPPQTPCEDGDPCTAADHCQDHSCVAVRVCAAQLAVPARTLGVQRIQAGSLLDKVRCSNPSPGTRRATACQVRALLPQVPAATLAADPGSTTSPTCDQTIAADQTTQITRDKARAFASTNDGTEQLDIPLKLNPLARKAIKNAYRNAGRASVVVCVTFTFNDGKTVTISDDLALTPAGRIKSTLRGTPSG